MAACWAGIRYNCHKIRHNARLFKLSSAKTRTARLVLPQHATPDLSRAERDDVMLIFHSEWLNNVNVYWIWIHRPSIHFLLLSAQQQSRTIILPSNSAGLYHCWQQKLSILDLDNYLLGLSQDPRSKIQIVICYFRIKSVLKLHNFLFITDLLLFLLTALSWLLFLLFWFRHFWHRLQNLNWSHWKLMNHDYRFLPAWTFLASSSWKIYRVLFWKVSQ